MCPAWHTVARSQPFIRYFLPILATDAFATGTRTFPNPCHVAAIFEQALAERAQMTNA